MIVTAGRSLECRRGSTHFGVLAGDSVSRYKREESEEFEWLNCEWQHWERVTGLSCEDLDERMGGLGATGRHEP